MTVRATNLGIEGLKDVEQIGSGGTSRVYRAHQTELDRVVAVKVLNPGGDQGVAKRFDRERKAMGRLSLHEGIVPIYSSGLTANGEPYLVMPYYANGSLQDQIDAGPMEWQTAVSYVDVAAETIAAAHDEGVVHLDLKPANILLTNTGAPRIADFGIARLLTGAATAGSTGGGAAFTPAYSAPETFLDDKTGPPADVYGLGATLWALLAGHPPFLTPGDDANLMAVIGRVVNNTVGDLRAVAPGPICDVLERAMAKRPEDRYQTAREFSLSLKHAAAQVSSDFSAPVEANGPSTTLFAAPVTAQAPAVSATPPAAPTTVVEQTSQSPAPATGVAAGAAAPNRPVPRPTGNRSLLQQEAQPLPAPVSVPPPSSPVPFIDFDRFRLGPMLFAFLAFIVLVGAAIWVINRESDRQAASTDSSTTAAIAPAGPESESASGGADGSTGSSTVSETDGTTTQTTVDSASSTSPSSATTATTVTSQTSQTTDTTTATTGTSETTDTTTPTSDTTTPTSDTTTPTSDTTTPTSDTTTPTSDTTIPVTPSPPTGLSAELVGDAAVRLTWSAPVTGPTPAGYQVSRNGVVILENVAATIRTDRDVPAGTYTYTVRSIGDDGSLSEPSAATGPVVVAPAPLAINTFSVTRLSLTPGSVTVAFSTNRCVTSYRIGVVPTGGVGPRPTAVTGPATGCVDSILPQVIAGLDPSLDYTVTLRVAVDTEAEIAQRSAPAPLAAGD